MLDKEFLKLEKEVKKESMIEEPVKEKKEKKVKTKKESFSIEEIQEKLAVVFNAITFFFKIEKEYKPSDFLEEAKDIVRLSQKYTIIYTILIMLDPLFLILSLGKKIMEMLKIVRKQKSEKQNEHKTA